MAIGFGKGSTWSTCGREPRSLHKPRETAQEGSKEVGGLEPRGEVTQKSLNFRDEHPVPFCTMVDVHQCVDCLVNNFLQTRRTLQLCDACASIPLG